MKTKALDLLGLCNALIAAACVHSVGDERGSATDNAGASSGKGGGASATGGSSSSAGAPAGGHAGANGNAGESSGGLGQGTDPRPQVTRGASVPYWEYEAEDSVTNGVVLAASRNFGEIAAESSGRRAVRLEATGQKVEFQLEHRANSIVVRYVIPDAPGGGGITTTLGLYVNGERKQSLELTSRYAWLYGGESNSENNTPGGGAHHFYDEVHALIGEVPKGSTIALQKDASDNAAYYVIDLVDFEQVAPAKTRPAGALSITDFGATADDGTDDSGALQQAIDAARSQNKPLFIPKGVFESHSNPLYVSGVTIRGAGMWHSKLQGKAAHFKVSGNNNQFYDFAVFGDSVARHEGYAENAFDGPAGSGSRLENIWMEHHKCGYWVGKGDLGHAPEQPLTDGLVIHGVRIRNTMADGVNFCNGTVNSVVEQSSIRNTGDDGLATWSPNFDGPQGVNNTFRKNTIQSPWRANCLAVYGGKDMKLEDNVCSDPVLYPGILIASTSQFKPHAFEGTTRILRNTLLRAGGPMYGEAHGALKFLADATPVWNVQIQDLLIEDATFSGIHIMGPSNVSGLSFENVEINGAGNAGILIGYGANGGAKASNLVVRDAATGLQNDAGGAWSFERGDGNTGW